MSVRSVLILGAGGAVCTPATIDILRSSAFDEVTLAGRSVARLEALRQQYARAGAQVRVVAVDAMDRPAVDDLVRAHGVVCNGLPWQVSQPVIESCVRHRRCAADLGTGDETPAALMDAAARAGVAIVNGCGATSGITNMLAKAGCADMDEVHCVDVSFAAFRPFALSPSLVDTILWEFEEHNRERVAFKDGAYVPMPALSGERLVEFPPPIGPQRVYCVPHEETLLLPRSLKAREVNVRGCFSPPAMELVRGLHSNGLINRQKVKVAGEEVSPWAFLCAWLPQVEKARQTPAWAYGLHVEVTGLRGAEARRARLWTTHPGEAEWGVPFAYTNNVGLPLSVAVHLLARGRYTGSGVLGPESFFSVDEFFEELRARGIVVHRDA